VVSVQSQSEISQEIIDSKPMMFSDAFEHRPKRSDFDRSMIRHRDVVLSLHGAGHDHMRSG
jgi:hypothetical protein